MHGTRRIVQQQGVSWSAECRPGPHPEGGFAGGIHQDVCAGRSVAYQEEETYSCLDLRREIWIVTCALSGAYQRELDRRKVLNWRIYRQILHNHELISPSFSYLLL
jgi:hypothetical protein